MRNRFIELQHSSRRITEWLRQNETLNCKLRLTNPIKSNKIKTIKCIACERPVVAFKKPNQMQSLWCLSSCERQQNAELGCCFLLTFQCHENMSVWIQNYANKNNRLKYELRRDSFTCFYINLWFDLVAWIYSVVSFHCAFSFPAFYYQFYL